MNEFSGFAKQVLGGWHAFVRVASDAEAKPVLTKGGKVRIFESEADALRTVTHQICTYVNGHLLRDGEKAGDAQAKADAHFPGIVKQRGRERRIEVIRK